MQTQLKPTNTDTNPSNGNHVNPSRSSGSSPGEAIATASHLHDNPPNSETVHDATAKYIRSNHPPFSAPHWSGEARPHGAWRVRLQTRFPSLPYLTYLVRDLGYNGHAAFAATMKAHQPWMHSVDRRRANPVDADRQVGTVTHAYSPFVSVAHPYIPAAPSRRSKTGGGLTEEQVEVALARKRWDGGMKKAVFEIVYGRRSTLQVSNNSGIPVEILSVYASRLRHDIQTADLRGQKRAA